MIDDKLNLSKQLHTVQGDNIFSDSKDSSIVMTTTRHHSSHIQSSSNRPKLFDGIVNRIRTYNNPISNDYLTQANSALFFNMNPCTNCKKFEEQVISLQHDRFAFEDEIKVLNLFYSIKLFSFKF